MGASAPLLPLADAARPAWRTAHRDGDKSSEETPLSPATILMGGAAPRNQLATWQPNTTYAVGTTILPQTPPQASPFSFVYRCVAINGSAKSSGTEPTWSNAPNVGNTIGDPSTGTPPNVIWQAMVDPLSVDPDDPLGLITTGLVSEPYETPNTWNTPLIVSTATDLDNGDPKQTGFMFGLYEPYDTANHGNLAEPQPPQMGATDPTHYWRDRALHAHYESSAMNRHPRTFLSRSVRGRPAARRRYRASFTLLELLVSLGIILILATLTMRLLNATLNSDRIRNAAREFQSFLAGARDRAVTPASRAAYG